MTIEVCRYDHADCNPKAGWFFEGGHLWIATREGEVVGTLEVGARRVIKMLAVAPSARGDGMSRRLLEEAEAHFAPVALLHDNHMSAGGEHLMRDFGISPAPGTTFERLADDVAELRAEQSLKRARNFLGR